LDPSRFRQNDGIDGLMAIVIFVLSFILLVAGAASGYTSLDLMPTGVGVLYALIGAVAVCASVLTFALAVAIRRIDALARLVRRQALSATGDVAPESGIEPTVEFFPTPAAVEPEPSESLGELGEAAAEGEAAEDESPININRAGHLPSLETVENALETAETPPSLIGRYSSGGTNYMIFADGSIEAETSEGTFKFASMGDFKRHLVERRGSRQAGE
jgi:hypothetical protein